MDPTIARQRVGEARVGRLGTVTPAGRPHLVPCCFALVDDVAFTAVDDKPKSTFNLRRLENIRRHRRLVSSSTNMTMTGPVCGGCASTGLPGLPILHQK